jgi:hypothetical protein
MGNLAPRMFAGHPPRRTVPLPENLAAGSARLIAAILQERFGIQPIQRGEPFRDVDVS